MDIKLYNHKRTARAKKCHENKWRVMVSDHFFAPTLFATYYIPTHTRVNCVQSLIEFNSFLHRVSA